MINKKFSLESAYSSGAKTVINYFMFFMLTMVVGLLACAVYLSVLGVIDIMALRHHLTPLGKMFEHVFVSPTGPLHHMNTTAQELIRAHLPVDISSQIIGSDVISIDVSGYEWGYLLSWLVPTALLFKLFIEMLAVGWTKIALDLDAKKSVSWHYMFSFYYLVPRVFVVSLIVGIVTIIGSFFFIIPGIFLYQRLRFARYFIIDKNLSIFKALEASWALTEGSVLHLIGFSMIATIIRSVGNILVLGLLFVLPLQNQVEANVYRQMVE